MTMTSGVKFMTLEVTGSRSLNGGVWRMVRQSSPFYPTDIERYSI